MNFWLLSTRHGFACSAKSLDTMRELATGATHALTLRRQATLLHCETGRLWVTLESEPRDFVVRAGETLVVQGPGRLVVLAVDAARFGLGPAPRVTALAA